MKLTRIFQPRNPRFWLLLVLNLLSAGLAWAMRLPGVASTAVVVMGMLALGNALPGMGLMWALMRDEPAAAPSQDAATDTTR